MLMEQQSQQVKLKDWRYSSNCIICSIKLCALAGIVFVIHEDKKKKNTID